MIWFASINLESLAKGSGRACIATNNMKNQSSGLDNDLILYLVCAGVASFVIYGCNSGYPSVCTSTGHFINWIDDIINYVVYGISASPTEATTMSPTVEPTVPPTVEPSTAPPSDSDEGNAAMGLVTFKAMHAVLAAAVLNY